MTNLRAIIDKEITGHGIITFARFMELALYCPNFGYYEHLERSPGRRGDFYTSVSVGSLFGELLAAQFAEWLEAVPQKERQIVEAGAHDGQLARDILHWLQRNHRELSDSLEYWILEPSERRRQSQGERLREFGEKVKWFTEWGAVPGTGVNGIIFSNELLDAMPVHRLGWNAAKREWFEWGVGTEEGKFVWKRMHQFQVSSFKFQGEGRAFFELNWSEELLAVLPDGFTTEICPAAVDWWRQAAAALRAGRLLTFDYGLEAEEFFAPERKDGTLRAYHAHRLSVDLLAEPGEQDLTAQVNFTAIRDAGEGAGLVTESFVTQGQFLMSMVQKLAETPEAAGWLVSRNRELQTLTHPEHLGSRFRVLTQSRGLGA